MILHTRDPLTEEDRATAADKEISLECWTFSWSLQPSNVVSNWPQNLHLNPLLVFEIIGFLGTETCDIFMLGVARGDGVVDGYLFIVDACWVPLGASSSSPVLFGQCFLSCLRRPFADANVTPQSFLMKK